MAFGSRGLGPLVSSAFVRRRDCSARSVVARIGSLEGVNSEHGEHCASDWICVDGRKKIVWGVGPCFAFLDEIDVRSPCGWLAWN